MTSPNTRSESDFLGDTAIGTDFNAPAGDAEMVVPLLAQRVAESVTLTIALNPIIGDEKVALIAKTALVSGGTIAEVAESLGIMSRADMNALLIPANLTQPLRLSTTALTPRSTS